MSPALLITLTAVAGGLGAALRLVLSSLVTRADPGALPRGTWLVNLPGSGALGLLSPLVASGLLCSCWFTILAGGLLGAMTTFSTWMVEIITLAERRALVLAAIQLLGQLALGFAAYFIASIVSAAIIG